MLELIFKLLLVAFIIWLGPFLTMTVWNWTIPNIFVGGPHINWLQAVGLMALGWLLTPSLSSSSKS